MRSWEVADFAVHGCSRSQLAVLALCEIACFQQSIRSGRKDYRVEILPPFVFETLFWRRGLSPMTTIYPLIMGREAMVSTEHYLSASAGARIFARGGNAIDAAVAATLVEGVVNPHMHTIGGEAPMLVRLGSNQRVVSING